MYSTQKPEYEMKIMILGVLSWHLLLYAIHRVSFLLLILALKQCKRRAVVILMEKLISGISLIGDIKDYL